MSCGRTAEPTSPNSRHLRQTDEHRPQTYRNRWRFKPIPQTPPVKPASAVASRENPPRPYGGIGGALWRQRHCKTYGGIGGVSGSNDAISISISWMRPHGHRRASFDRQHWGGHKTWRNRWRDVIGIGGSKKLSTGLTGLTGQFIGKTSNPYRGIGGILAFFMEE